MLRALLPLGALALVLAAGSAAAADVDTFPNCVLVTDATLAHTYQNACAMHDDGWRFAGEGYDYSYRNSRLASTSMAVTSGPVRVWGFDTVAQETYRFEDSWGTGSSTYETQRTDVNTVRGVSTALVGAGAYGGLTQERATYEFCDESGCSGFASRSTSVQNGAYVSYRSGPGVGASVNYHQVSDGSGCQESANVQATVVYDYFYEPLLDPAPCTAEAPDLAREHPFPAWPDLLPTV